MEAGRTLGCLVSVTAGAGEVLRVAGVVEAEVVMVVVVVVVGAWVVEVVVEVVVVTTVGLLTGGEETALFCSGKEEPCWKAWELEKGKLGWKVPGLRLLLKLDWVCLLLSKRLPWLLFLN